MNHPHPASAAVVLTGAHATLSAALGIICLLAWYIIHRLAAHRHPVAEVIAKILLVVGGVILAVTIGITTGWITDINDATASWFTSASKDPTFVDKHIGILSFLAIFDAAFVAFTTYDLIRKSFNKRQGQGGSQPAGRGGWSAAEHMANKYGWFSLGPLSVTLPGTAGVWIVTLLTAVAEFVGHLIGSPFGLG